MVPPLGSAEGTRPVTDLERLRHMAACAASDADRLAHRAAALDAALRTAGTGRRRAALLEQVDDLRREERALRASAAALAEEVRYLEVAARIGGLPAAG